MDMEQVENDLYPMNLVQNLGFQSVHHFEEFRQNAIHGLLKYGGNFAETLGKLLQFADRVNAVKIINVWHQECEQHGHLYKIFLAKQKAKSSIE